MRPTLRLAALSLAAALSACALSFPVELVRELPLSAPAGDATVAIALDLSEDGGVWKHRADVEDFTVEAVRAAVIAVGEANRAAALDLDLHLRPEGAPEDGSEDVLAASVKGLELAPGARAELAGTRGLERLLLGALRGSGRLTAVARTRAGAEVDALLEVRIAGAVQYEVVSR